MRKIKSCLMIIIHVCLLTFALPIKGQVSGPEQVIAHARVSFTHSLKSPLEGTSFVWEADKARIILESCDSLVVKWEKEGEYSVVLSLLDSSDYTTELLEEIPVTVVIPVVEYGYDAAGNRIRRSVQYKTNGIKKTKKSRKDVLKELEITTQTMVYPNPTKNLIYLRVNNEITAAKEKQFIIYDNLGRMVMDQEIDNTLMEINVSGLKEGVYYLVVKYDDHQKDWKIIKN